MFHADSKSGKGTEIWWNDIFQLMGTTRHTWEMLMEHSGIITKVPRLWGTFGYISDG